MSFSIHLLDFSLYAFACVRSCARDSREVDCTYDQILRSLHSLEQIVLRQTQLFLFNKDRIQIISVLNDEI